MKKQMICLGFLFISAGMVKAQDFTVKAHLDGITAPQKVFLSYRTNGETVSDSVLMQNGDFSFKGKVDNPVKANLTLKPVRDDGPMTLEKMMNIDRQDFYLEPGIISVSGKNMKTAKINGGPSQSDYLLLQSNLKALENEMKPLSEKMQQYFKDKNEEGKKELMPQLQAIRAKMTDAEDVFIFKHPDSYVSLGLVQMKGVVIEPQKFKPFYDALSKRLRNTETGIKLGERLAIAEKTEIGKPAINFTQNDTEERPVSLASLKGKYVLVDFWASWCGPCRAENPNVLKAYNKYKDKNFEIIGVSLDDKKAPWLEAIKKDGLPWIHVSDLKGWQNEVAKEYGVIAVPQNFLIDPNGVIIAKNLRGEKLDEILSSLIK